MHNRKDIDRIIKTVLQANPDLDKENLLELCKHKLFEYLFEDTDDY